MNREQRRQQAKQMGLKPGETMNLNAIMVQFDNGNAMYLDVNKVQLVDRESGQPLFDEVLEPIAPELAAGGVVDAEPVNRGAANTPASEFPDDGKQSYRVQFDTPEGPMEYVKDGNFSGVRPLK